jgi:hypothetical protein
MIPFKAAKLLINQIGSAERVMIIIAGAQRYEYSDFL